MQLRKGKRQRPRRVLFYGTKGWGKSTWANIPGSVFVNIEDGLDDIDCVSTEWLLTFESVVAAIGSLINSPDMFSSVVIDSADWLEGLIFKQVADEAGKENIEQIGYGKGYETAANKLLYLIQGLDQLRAKKGCHVVFLAHEQVVRFNAPGGDSYDRYTPALHKTMSPVLTEWCDEVLYAGYKVLTHTEDLGFNKKRNYATGGNIRFIRTTETAAIVAKNRLGLPDELSDTSWNAYAAHFQHNGNSVSVQSNINGIVIDGSSKTKPEEVVSHG